MPLLLYLTKDDSLTGFDAGSQYKFFEGDKSIHKSGAFNE